jgi:hypothetical protein
MTKTVRGAVAALALCAPLIIATTPADAAAPKYRSCDGLMKVWPNGVAKSKAASNKAVRDGYSRPPYGPRARAVYWENHANLDRDDDGTACEN